MTQEDKNLIFRDLCARLPYRVRIHAKYFDTDTYTDTEKDGELSLVDDDAVIAFTCDDINCYNYVAINEVKPYLFPLSSMTEEQKQEYGLVLCGELSINQYDWLNANHFDYRGLIEKGLANDVTGLNIY